jgi:RNA polymerase sigma factor (sigma-70 family)
MITVDDIKGMKVLKRELDSIRDKLEELETRAIGVGAIVIDGTPRSASNTNAKEQAYTSYIAQVQLYEERLKAYIERLNEAEDFIQQLPPLRREVLRLKYIDGRTTDDVADTLNYSREAIRYHIKKAFEELRQEANKSAEADKRQTRGRDGTVRCSECVFAIQDWTNQKNTDKYCSNEDAGDRYGSNITFLGGCYYGVKRSNALKEQANALDALGKEGE